MKKIQIINANEKKEDFSAEKIYQACRRSGASKKIANEVTEEIKKLVQEGMKTSKIGKLVKELLAKKSKKSSIKFSLKEAMRKLGPTGFNFEKFIADVLLENGYKVKINQRLPGFCVNNYEIDFIAQKGNVEKIGECKYHSSPGSRVDLKIALYNHARFLDIEKNPLFQERNLKSILVTNAKFTTKAIKYSQCNQLELLGWRYPKDGGLEKIIEDLKLYPITILPSFKKHFKNIFAAKRIMLAQDILQSSPKQISQKTDISIKEVNKLVEEANILLK